MKKRKLLFLIQELETGGAQRVCVNLANYFAAQGDSVAIALLFHKKQTIYSLHPAIRIINVPPLRFGRHIAVYLFRIQLFFQNFKPDTVIAFMWHANVFASIFAKITGIPAILSERSNPLKAELDETLVRLGKVYFPYASCVVVLNKGIINFFQNEMGISPNQIIVIPNAAAKPSLVKQEKIYPFPYCLAVGRLQHVKGFDRLIAMFSKVLQQHPEEHLVICGVGAEKKNLELLAEELQIFDRVIFAGECRDLAPYYRYADALLFTSHYEGWPNVILEAMSYGLPPIAFDCCYGPAEMIHHEINGLLIPQDDCGAFVRETNAYLNNLDIKRVFYSKNCLRTVENFTFDKVFNLWNVAINSVLRNSSGGN